MGLALTVTLGILFLVVAFAVVFLMFHLWGYPFDKATRTSAAPPGLMRLHRVLGWIYLIIYVVMMSFMIPRLWQYQVELPARTVAHLLFGIGIGIILLLKLSILRFFRHFEEWMPVLGSLLLACTIFLSTLSLPFALREFTLASGATAGGVYSDESRERVAKLLPQAGLPGEALLDDLSSQASLRAGRDVLADKCVVCHDLKTILVLPRTPSGWWKTVERMVNKPSFSEPITELESFQVTAYLIAISGDLQRSAKERKAEEEKRKTAAAEVGQEAASAPAAGDGGELPPFDRAQAAATFERVCSACHGLGDVEAKPPRDSEEVKDLIIRMIRDNGMEAPKEDLDLVYLHMVEKYAGGKILPAADAAPSEAAGEPAGDGAGEPATETPTDTAESAGESGSEAAPEKPAKATKPAGPSIDGKPFYDKYCKGCHGADGKGSAAMQKNNIPDLSDRGWQGKHSKAKVVSAITNGIPDTKMKSFKDKMSADEIAALAAYVKKIK